MISPDPEITKPIKEFSENAGDRENDAYERQVNFDENHDRAVEEYDDRKQLFNERRVLRTALLTSFQNGSLDQETQWSLQAAHPLPDLEQGPADILIANSPEESVFCIIGIVRQPNGDELTTRCNNIVSYLINNPNIVYERFGAVLSSENAYIAVAVSNIDTQTIVRNIGDHSAHDNRSSHISIWPFISGENEELRIVESADEWDPYVPDDELGQKLQDGHTILDNFHNRIKVFLDSHHETIYRHVVPKMYRRHHDTDKSRSNFSISELCDEIDNAIYEERSREEVHDRATELVDWWMKTGMVQEPSSKRGYNESDDVYNFTVSFHSHSSISDDIKEEYTSNQAKAIIEAKKKADILDGRF